MFVELAKANAAFIAGHSGETIEYRRHPGGAFASTTGYVLRDPTDVTGAVHTDTVHAYMPKAELLEPTLQKDQLRVAQKRPGSPLPTYRVVEVISQGPGHWWLRAVRCAD